ncbi:hypothetical protein G1H11_05330 [Phytoactinopolyspora alkaliphila]|uniref:Uncharacterized protein n=1 Tax=Phytoactinopolyspora alkaliphila TaxID=1783498 RepID=A0A6N9YIJ9_9ACTN|nr:hypothetical protein [Phytoactinopolyspora alkaliphila]NED94728.1 hypothetical protein [Phytoactinopolyspora alkaliphila]
MPNNLPHHSLTSTAVREDEHWFVTCDQYPSVHSSARLLTHAREDQRLRIAAHLDVPASTVSVEVRARLPTETAQRIDRAQNLRGTASWANGTAAKELREAARTLVEMNLSLRDVGTILGVSHQRAHQIIHPKPRTRRRG